MNNGSMISLAAAGRKIGKSATTLAKWSQAGLAPRFLTFNGRRYVVESQFDRWWNERTRVAMGQSNGDGNRAAA